MDYEGVILVKNVTSPLPYELPSPLSAFQSTRTHLSLNQAIHYMPVLACGRIGALIKPKYPVPIFEVAL